MRKHFWRIEYSIILVVVFAVILMLIPTRFIAPKEASYISSWNDTYHKMEYVFSAMTAHADADVAKGFRSAKTDDEREKLMIALVKPYLRLDDVNILKSRYKQSYMNGDKVEAQHEYSFDNLYLTKENKIVGIKDVKDDDIYHPAFIMMFDVNGLKGPNRWGKDVFGLNIFVDGKISPLGAGLPIEALKTDCSEVGTGVFCSYYYRIGGDFKE